MLPNIVLRVPGEEGGREVGKCSVGGRKGERKLKYIHVFKKSFAHARLRGAFPETW